MQAKKKEARVWEGGSLNHKDSKSLNYSADSGSAGSNGAANGVNGNGMGVDVSLRLQRVVHKLVNKFIELRHDHS